MRLLGFLFVIVLLLAAVGWFRGWFSVTTHASGNGDVTLEVDNDRIRDDAQATAAKIGQLSAKAAAAVKSMGRKVSAEESDLEGTLAAVDLRARDLTVTAGSQTIELHVPSSVAITRDKKSVGFEQLQPTTRVRLTFHHTGDDRSLSRIEILE